MNLKEIRDRLNKIVFYQSELIDVLSLCMIRHGLKINCRDEELSSTPNNLLIVGNTGTGKTFSVKQICKMTKYPYIEINAKSICQEGWHGKSFLDLMREGLNPYLNDDLRLYPVILVDEFDKFCKPSDSSSHADIHEILQSTILKYVEGFIFEHKQIYFDTSKFCFIFSGSFTGLLKEGKKNIGFQEHISTTSPSDLTTKLLHFGIIPEVMGRITRLIKTNDITEQVYRDILCNPEFISNRWFRYLKERGIDRTQEPNYSAIITEAVEKNLGVRGLIQGLEIEIDRAIEDYYMRVSI